MDMYSQEAKMLTIVFTVSVFFFGLILIVTTYQTLATVLCHISKHLECRQKYCDVLCIFKFLRHLKCHETLTRVTSVSVGSRSKERSKKGIFVVLPARGKMVREPKKERGGWGRGRKDSSPPPFFRLLRHFSRGHNTESPVPRSFFAPQPHGNAFYAG